MAKQEFFKGERVVATRKRRDDEPGVVIKKYAGTFKRLTHNGLSEYPYRIEWDNLGRRDRDFPTEIPSLDKYDIQRLNETELTDGFEEALQTELGLVKKLAADSDSMAERAATLASLRNLARYLSAEIDKQYQEAERLSREADLTGRAAALATLRNLNQYLQGRKKQQESTSS